MHGRGVSLSASVALAADGVKGKVGMARLDRADVRRLHASLMTRPLRTIIGIAAFAAFLVSVQRSASADVNQGWIEVRQVADQFEQIRALFHTAFPNLRVDPAEPLLILAAKNENTMMMLLRCEARRWLQGVNRVLKALEIEVVRRQFLYLIYRMHISIYLRRNPRYLFPATVK